MKTSLLRGLMIEILHKNLSRNTETLIQSELRPEQALEVNVK